mgnify:CR=1 FL=1
MGTKEDILGAKDCGVLPIDIPEWGGTFHIRVLPGPDLDDLVTAQARLGGDKCSTPAKLAAEVVARCLCNESGVRLFADQDIGALAGKSAKVLARVAASALDFNGLTDQAVEQLRGN